MTSLTLDYLEDCISARSFVGSLVVVTPNPYAIYCPLDRV